MSKVEFPLQRKYTPDKAIQKMFLRLQKYRHERRLITEEYQLNTVAGVDLTFDGEPKILVVYPEDYEEFERISSMFTEECRMKCQVMQNPSPWDFFHANYDKVRQHAVEKFGDDTAESLRESLYSMSKECTSHKPQHIMGLIQMFGAKRVLDPSSGWGDRLIGAMAANVDFYCGVDPNECLHPGYRQMMEFFNIEPSRYELLNCGIEDADLSKYPDFDLVFTSPPYFDLEIYTGENQSVSKFSTEDRWCEGFLIPMIDKCFAQLVPNGHLAININQKHRGEKYINRMVDHMKTIGKYRGVISYRGQLAGKRPQPIFIVQKVTV